MYDLTDINQIKRLLNKNGFQFSKALGQNFIIDPDVCPRMAEEACLDENTGVLEIGSGIGVLTVELARRAGKVLTTELDTRLIPVLADTLRGMDNVEVLNADIMKLDIPRAIEQSLGGCGRLVVCANLPYYITSPIIMRLLEGDFGFTDYYFMVQKEAGERLCAEVGSRKAGAVTVAVAYRAESELLFPVSRDCFLPAPKVDSQVIALHRLEKPPVAPVDQTFFFDMIRAAFSQRRKTAANGISSGLGMQKQAVFDALAEAGLAQSVRAESLTMPQLSALCDALYKRRDS